MWLCDGGGEGIVMVEVRVLCGYVMVEVRVLCGYVMVEVSSGL